MKTFSLATMLASIALPAVAEITVNDRNDRTITLDGQPDLVLCLLNRCAEEMAAIGVPLDRLAFGRPWTHNVAQHPINYGEAAADSPTILADDETDWEAAAALEPDLIIVQTSRLEVAEQIAPVYTLSWDDRESDDAWVHDARAYGVIFGMEEEVEAQIDALLSRVAAYIEMAPGDRTMALLNLTSDTEIGLVNDCDYYMR